MSDFDVNSEKRKWGDNGAGYEVREMIPWNCPPRKNYRDLEHRLHDEIIALVAYIQPTAQEWIARQTVFRATAEVLTKQFPYCDVRLFGSVAQGLCLPDSDLDISVSLYDEQGSSSKILYPILGALRKAGIAGEAFVNRRAKVPVLAATMKPQFGGFKADISINNFRGVQAISIVNDYLMRMHALRPLVMVVKTFLAQRQLNSAAHSGLNSYALICMVIHFLQANPSGRPRDFIEKPMEKESLGVLLVDFFYYYGITFPYSASYISITQRKLLPRTDSLWSSKELLVIDCPIQPGQNVARAASKMKEVKAAFQRAFTILTAIPFPIETDNNLGLVISVPQAILSQREHVRGIVDSGTLATATAAIQYRENRSIFSDERGRDRGRSFTEAPSSRFRPQTRRPRRTRRGADEYVS